MSPHAQALNEAAGIGFTAEAEPVPIKTKVRAIVQFGHPSPLSGFKPGEYYQVTIDPNMLSPKGNYIRFDQRFQTGSEIHGWQRVDALTVCEILGEAEEYEGTPSGYSVAPDATVVMRVVK